MQKLRARSQVRLYDKQILPTLKANSASFMGRTIVPISKFDLDSNIVLKQQRRLKMMTKIQVSENNSRQKPKIKKNIIQNGFPLDQMFKLSTSDSKRQTNNDNFQDLFQNNILSKTLVNIQPSKTSSKHYGLVRGYAANSHPGLYNLANQDRICIVTNLNKTNVKPKQVSFFSIYDGSNGLLKTDYFRDNFHLILNSQQQLMTDPQKAIKNTIQKIQKNMTNQLMYMEDTSKVGYAIVMTIGQSGYAICSGSCRILVSKKFGEQIQKVSMTNGGSLGLNHITKIQNGRKIFLKKQDSINVCIKKIDLESNLDFILLGSEGLFENLKQQQIVKKSWGNMLKTKNETIHSCLGEGTLSILHAVFGLPSTKNASLIMLGFKNIEECFKKSQKIVLPHLQQ